ncbi:MAG TPA: hypothetical protein VGO71_01950 [Baekduia sp.]|jgi:hypothetical protein|nr:hypothetical protein [Baekduia sp.]
MALVTAVLGACAGANFALIARDMASEPGETPVGAEQAAAAAEPVAV